MQKKNNERPTACIRNSGFSAKSKVSAFNKSQCQTESEVLFNPLLLIHPNRYTACKKIQEKNCICNGAFYNGEIKCTKDLRT